MLFFGLGLWIIIIFLSLGVFLCIVLKPIKPITDENEKETNHRRESVISTNTLSNVFACSISSTSKSKREGVEDIGLEIVDAPVPISSEPLIEIPPDDADEIKGEEADKIKSLFEREQNNQDNSQELYDYYLNYQQQEAMG